MVDAKAVSGEIVNQLGGNRAMSMIGTKKLVFSQNGNDVTLNIHFAAKAKKVNGKSPNIFQVTYVHVSDLYTIAFLRIHGTNLTTLETTENVFCDQLVEMFETTTGLYLSL